MDDLQVAGTVTVKFVVNNTTNTKTAAREVAVHMNIHSHKITINLDM